METLGNRFLWRVSREGADFTPRQQKVVIIAAYCLPGFNSHSWKKGCGMLPHRTLCVDEGGKNISSIRLPAGVLVSLFPVSTFFSCLFLFEGFRRTRCFSYARIPQALCEAAPPDLHSN